MKMKNILLSAAGVLFLAGFVFAGHASAALNTDQKQADASDLSVFGRIKQLNTDIFKYNSDPAKKNLLLVLVKERKDLIKELARKNPRFFLAVAIKASQKSGLSSSVQPYIEQETTLVSKIKVKHIDDFKNRENSRFDYFLTSGGAGTNYYPTADLYLASGATIMATGFKLEDVFVSDTSKKNFQVTQKAPQPESVGDQKTLVILLDFLNSGQHPFTDDEAYNMVFNDQFQNFFKEQSYNQVFFSGEVVDWYKLNKSSQSGGCEGTTSSELEKIVNERNINLANYKRLLFLPNKNAGGGWSNVGPVDWLINNNVYKLSEACVGLNEFNEDSGWGKQSFSWTNFDYVMSHEMGHSLGVMHANGWDCGNKTLYGDCFHIEYGNPFDTMGDGSYSLHFNALYKEILGWIKPNRFINVNRTGNYAINTLEKDSGAIFAKISTLDSSDTPYYLEYRKAWGFDSKLNEQTISSNQTGLFINNAIKNQDGTIGHSRLLDASATSAWWSDDITKTTLNANSIFDDPGSGITISNVSNANDNYINFTATLKPPSCVRGNPGLWGISKYLEINAGATGAISSTFYNTDSTLCGKSDFNVFVTELPKSWQFEIIPAENISLAHDEPGWKVINIIVPRDTIPGFYQIKYDIVNITSGYKTSQEVSVEILPPIRIFSVIPDSGPKETKIKINGEGFQHSNNSVLFTNDKIGSYVYSYNSFDGKSIDFTVPSEINLYGCDGGFDKCTISTPEGVYDLQIFAGSASSNIVNFKVVNNATTTSNLKITKVTGPERLKIGELGSWTIEATDNNNRPLSFSAIWEDEGITATGTPKGAPKFNPTSTGAILTHVYYISGKFQPIFIVKNDLGEQTSTTTAVLVEGSSRTITVLSPNGGEKFQRGTMQKIVLNANVLKEQVILELYKKTEKGDYEVINIGKTTTSGDGSDVIYYWSIPNNLPDGDQYKIHAALANVFNNGKEVEDFSDSYFSIINYPGWIGSTATSSSSSSGGGKGAPQLSSEKCNFYRDLTIGFRGADVTCLQNYLVSGGHFPAYEPSRGYFGPLTKSSVAKWQVANTIYPPTGYFGALSRAKYYGLMDSAYSSDAVLSSAFNSSSGYYSFATSSQYSSYSSSRSSFGFGSSYSSSATSSAYSSRYYSSSATSTTTNSSSATSTTTGAAITVVSPNGGERWYQGSTYYISWLVSNLPNDGHEYWISADLCDDYRKTCLSKQDAGLLKKVRVGNGSGRVRWLIPATVVKGKYQIVLSLYDKTVHPEGLIIANDASNSTFDIIDPNAPGDVGTGTATSSYSYSSASSRSYFSTSSAVSSYVSSLSQKYSLGFVANGGGKIFFINSPASNISGMNYLYKVGDIVTVVAVPSYGYTFNGWYDCGELSVTQTTYSDSDTCRVTVSRDMTLRANFAAVSTNSGYSSSVYRYSSSSLAPGANTASSVSPGTTAYSSLSKSSSSSYSVTATPGINTTSYSSLSKSSSSSYSVTATPGINTTSSTAPGATVSSSSKSSSSSVTATAITVTSSSSSKSSSSSSVSAAPGGASPGGTSVNQSYILAINKIGSGKVGSATYPSIDISGKTFSLTAGTVYTVVATPALGSIFAGWTGCDNGSFVQTTNKSGDTCKIIMPSSNKIVTAKFFSLFSSTEDDQKTAAALNSISAQLQVLINSLNSFLGI